MLALTSLAYIYSSIFWFQTKYLFLIGWLGYAVVMVAVKIITHKFEGKQCNIDRDGSRILPVTRMGVGGASEHTVFPELKKTR